MSNVKELKSIELASFTTMASGISVLFSIIAAIILTIFMVAFVPNGGGVAIYLIPTVIVGSFMYTIYNSFCDGLLYNMLSKKLKTIAMIITDNGEVVKISTTETATMTAIILTIQGILLYLVSVFVLPLLLTSVIQTLMYTGQSTIAYSLYQLLAILSQPTTILILIFSTFIITFVFVLLGTYIYNFVAKSGRAVVLKLSDENGLTVIDSVDPLKMAAMFAIISGVLSIISGVISIISGANAASFIGSVIGGFVGGFVEFYLIAAFYNFLAPKLGKIKLELIDFRI